ncbi:MAG: thioesterase family protein [Candidatus Cloacimonetes bacterium]|nr:acyl-CoA thioesterase [Candidatus Cloacimonadota bacterium]MDD4156347.1 thioesterase family protein [Candidatus Cloacimonadota bacterium]
MIFKFIKKIYGFECDIYGHLNNANYLQIYESARAEALSEMDMSISRLRELNISLYVIRVEIDYKKGIELEDTIMVLTKITENTRLSAFWYQEIYNSKGELCSKVLVKGVYVKDGKPYRIDKELCAYFDKFVEIDPD